MGQTKLKLEVNLYTDVDKCGDSESEIYCVSFIFLDIDEKISENSYVSFTAKNRFRVEYSNNVPCGLLKYDCINIPRHDKVGFELKRIFLKEEDRYVFVRRVYEALRAWSVNMYNFDGTMFVNRTKFKIKNNLWMVKERDVAILNPDIDDLYSEQRYRNIFM